MANASDSLDELVRLSAIILRLRIGNQADTIREMGKAGFGPTRIAELLGTTAGTVNVEIARGKKKKKKASRAPKTSKTSKATKKK